MFNFLSKHSSSIFLMLASLASIGVFGVLLTTDIPECRIESQRSVGFVFQANEIATSFNDFRRMKIDVIDTVNIGDFDGSKGFYFIKGVTNVRNKDEVFLVNTSCGTKIKFGSFDKLFGTFEPK